MEINWPELEKKYTTFQIRVWKELTKIPRRETRTYKEVAIAIGNPKAYRAVANACGKNPLQIIIPCHRVVGTNNLGGYKWGIEKKKELLKSEREE